MHAAAAFLLAVAGCAAAQTAPSGCGNSIDLIIESCLGTTKAQFDACTPNDWDCLCEQANNVLTCYNNCPSAPDRFGFEQTKVANCNAASAYGTSSSASHTATATTTPNVAASNSTTNTPPTTADDDDSSASGTPTGTAATSTATTGSGAASVAVPAGLAAIFGLVAFL